jgi:hypothetical protein
MASRLRDMPNGIPAKCLSCTNLFRAVPEQWACPRCGSRSVVALSFLSTAAILTGILTILAWQLELFALGIGFFAGQKMNWIGHVTLIGFSTVMTLFAYTIGKKEIARVRGLGVAAITWFQGLLVVLLVVGFALLLVVFGMWQRIF